MKTIAILLAMLLGSVMYGQSVESGKITTTVPNIIGEDGEVLFALYTEASFMKKEPDFSFKAEIVEGKATANFENVPAGRYSIVVLHDKNGNGRMDFDANGVPQEDYGTSGNSMTYGPPTWEDSNFEFDGGSRDVEIRF